MSSILSLSRRLARKDYRLISDKCGDLDFAVRMLAGRLTPLYLVVLGVIGLCVIHFRGKMPWGVLAGPGSVLALAVLARLYSWRALTRSRVSRRTALAGVKRLHQVGPMIGLFFSSWMMLLYVHSTGSDMGLIHLITATTGIITVLCLGATPYAAVLVACSILLPSSLVYLVSGHPNGEIIAIVQATIFAVVIRIVFLYQSDLLLLSNSRRTIALREIAIREVAAEESRLAHTDELTGLRNRRAFLDELQNLLSEEGECRLGLAIMDLDGFKDINDSLGHVAGDRLLQVLSRRLVARFPDRIIGRLGGDEFAILFASTLREGLPDRLKLEEVALLVTEPIEFDNLTFGVGVSIGYVEEMTSQLSVKDCLERADHAMYTAKKQEGPSVVIYGDELDRELRNRQRLVSTISQPGFEKFLNLAFQPIVDVRSNGVVGVEALSRWCSPGLDDVTTSEFIRLAESSGQMNQITKTIVAKAARDCPVWENGGSLFINISGHDLMRPGALGELADLITQHGAPPENIVFEVTETAIVNIDVAVQTLGTFRDHGFRFALDDFGAGLSSLSRVHRLPINVLKVDGGFAEHIVDDYRCRAAVGTVIELARQMKIDCVIEGIETSQQALHASRLGGRLMQGYLFGKPTHALDVRKMLEAQIGTIRSLPVAAVS